MACAVRFLDSTDTSKMYAKVHGRCVQDKQVQERGAVWCGEGFPARLSRRCVDDTRLEVLNSTAPPGQSRGYTTLLLATQGRRVTSSNIDKKTKYM